MITPQLPGQLFYRRMANSMLMLCLFTTSVTTWALGAGTVAKLDGEAVITTVDGHEKRLEPGTEVEQGDRITTRQKAELVVKFTDGGVVAMRPNSELAIKSYRFQQSGESDNFVVRLFRGGLRSLTGQLGKRSPKNVRFETTTATIGIRGTDFEMTVREDDTPEAGAGTYNRVFEGSTYLQNSAGQQVVVNANQAAFSPVDIARMAKQFGLIKGNVPDVFFTGKFDDILGELKNQAFNQLQKEFDKAAPPVLRGLDIKKAIDLFK